jgi:hypothetical protein
MRRSYYELQKAYYCLLGYKWDDCESSKTLERFVNRECPKVTTAS